MSKIASSLSSVSEQKAQRKGVGVRDKAKCNYLSSILEILQRTEFASTTVQIERLHLK
jgi:hypothetical protein